MRLLIALMLTIGFLAAATMGLAERQGPGRQEPSRPGEGDDLVVRMMEFDKDKDGKLTRVEITDARLIRLFDRSDANKDGIVTKEELASLAAKEESHEGGGFPGGPPGGFGGGPPGFGGRGGGPPGGGPPGFMMGMPRPGEILPRMVQERLKLTPDQKDELDDLQKDVDAKLDKILSSEQKAQLKQMRERGPGGFGPPGGRGRPGGGGFGGPGGPGGPPPPGGGGPPPPGDEF